MPQDIINSMPNIFLDGELWYFYLSLQNCHRFRSSIPPPLRFGRDNFEESMRLIKKVDPSDLDWKNFRFMVFDQPNHPGTYEQRFNSIGTLDLSVFADNHFSSPTHTLFSQWNT